MGLTKAEKLALKKQKAEQRKHLALEKKKQHFRDFLNREIKYTNKSRAILDEHWEKTCSEMASLTLVKSLNCTRQHLIRQLDTKDIRIENMLDYLDQANDQYSRRFNGHVGVIDYVMKCYNFFLDLMKRNYEDECRKVYRTFIEEITRRQQILDEQTRNYEIIQLTDNEKIKTVHENLNIELEDRKAEVTSWATNLRNIHQLKVESKMNQVRKLMLEIINEYQSTIAEPKKMEVFNRMAMNVACFSLKSKGMDDEARKCQREISKLKRTLTELELFFNYKIQMLKRKRNEPLTEYLEQKKKLEALISLDKSKLGQVVILSNRALKSTAGIFTRAEKLLKLSLMCTKLEKPQEKIFRQINVLKGSDDVGELTHSCLHRQNHTNSKNFNEMGIFWEKLSAVTIKRNTLNAEKEELKLENESLKCLFKEYCTQDEVKDDLAKLGYGRNLKPFIKIPSQEASLIPQIRRTFEAKKWSRFERSPVAMNPPCTKSNSDQ